MERLVARANDIVAEEFDDGLVIYDEREAQAHWLDPGATAVWHACQEPNTEAEIARAAGLHPSACEIALAQLIDLGLVEAESGLGYSRRAMLRSAAKVGLAGAVAVPIMSTFVPAAAAQSSVSTGAGAALTPGYWRNHQNATTALLTIDLGGYAVANFADATAVFDDMNCGNSGSQNAFGCLAGQLLAAKLNVANGAPNSCIGATIMSADSLLESYAPGGYVGPTGTYTLTSSQRSAALGLATTLSNYNMNGC